MACPICIAPEGATIAEGVRAGALVLILVTALVLTTLVRFAWRLWSLRHLESGSPSLARDSEARA